MKRFAVILLACWLSGGCLPTVAGVAAYKIAQNRTQNNYREYVTQTEKDNQVRADNKMPPMHVKTFEEWKAAGR